MFTFTMTLQGHQVLAVFGAIQCRIVLSPQLAPKNISLKCTKLCFPTVLYGSETWSLTLREECRQTAFENRVLRKSGAKKMRCHLRETVFGAVHWSDTVQDWGRRRAVRTADGRPGCVTGDKPADKPRVLRFSRSLLHGVSPGGLRYNC
jgi:hypothetical protein